MNYIKLFENFEDLNEIEETIKEILYPLSDDGIEYDVKVDNRVIKIFINEIIPINYVNEISSLMKYLEIYKYEFSYAYQELEESIEQCPECRSNELILKTEMGDGHFADLKNDIYQCVKCNNEDRLENFITFHDSILKDELLNINQNIELVILFEK